MSPLDEPVWSLVELLARVDVLTVEALSDLVDEHNELDTWLEVTVDGVEVRCGSPGTGLAFPFDVSEFWSVVEETEQDALDRDEDAAGS